MKLKLIAFSCSDRGNVAVMFAFASFALLIGAGVAVDFSLMSREKARLNMIADEASLAAVSNSSMQLTVDQATTLATNIFKSQVSTAQNVTLDAGQPSISVAPDASGLTRTATVSYSGNYAPVFGNLLGVSKLRVSGTSVAKMSLGANIDFHVLLDNQGSMALPDSQAGVSQLEGLTPKQNPGGCAFACHEQAPNSPTPPFAADTQGNPCVAGASGNGCPQIDNYQLARNNGIRLRFDDVASAMGDLVGTMTQLQQEQNPQPTYRLAVYSVDAPYTQGLYNIMPLSQNFASDWSSASPNLQLYTVWSDGGACVAGGTPCASGAATANASVTTYYDVGFFSSPIGAEMQTLANTIPVAGTGGVNSKPRQLLLIVTDGVEDKIVNGSLSITAWDSDALAACTTLKNNGVRIAIVYTNYYPTPGFWLYDDYVANFQSSIGSTLQSCASSGYFITAQLGDSISKDLQLLATMAAQSPRLTQ